MSYRRWLLLFCLLGLPLPAYANNPPLPDGLLSVLLIFPVAILGLRLAGVRRDEQKKPRRLLTGLILGFAFLLTMGGTEIGGIGLVFLLSYGLHRGAYAIFRGQGAKRFAVGTAVILYTLFAVANYVASLDYETGPRRYESSAVGALRTINFAEATFQADARLDVNKNGVGEYGTLEQLQTAGLIGPEQVRAEQQGYRLTLVVTGDPAKDEREYFVSAIPINYGHPRLRRLSLLAAWKPAPPFALRTFASDEFGVIRGRDLGSARAVTREETEKWEPID